MSSLDETAEPLPNVPGYDVLSLIGAGGMGRVYLARQRALGRAVCVKVLALPAGGDDGSGLERFQREARLLAMVAHPHILTILDFGTLPDDGRPFLVTEYIENGDLRKLLRGGRTFSTTSARAILSQIGQALAHLHQKNILHRDLKPENILTPTDNLVKVADFGLAVLESEKGEITRTNRGIGTLVYASPEQQNGRVVDARSDQFSLAAVAYELLTGKRPVGAFKPPSEVNPSLDRSIDPVLMKALAHDPEGRYARLEGFLADLDRALASRRPPSALGLTAGGLAASALVAAMAAYIGGWFSSPPPPPPPPRPVAPAPAPAVAEVVDAAEPAPAHPKPSEAFHQLTAYRAKAIWIAQGSPEGAAGEAVSEGNWYEAEKRVQKDVDARAYEIWISQGSPVGEAGEAVREANRRRAEAELLEEAERSLHADVKQGGEP